MLSDTNSENRIILNPVQQIPNRVSVYGINKCEDQTIGFQFINQTQKSRKTWCCDGVILNLCIPTELPVTLNIERAEFWATDDPCYEKWVFKKIEEPFIEIIYDTTVEPNLPNGILVRFSGNETCCVPIQMAFKLYGFDDVNCKYTLAQGLLVFR